jgi:multidrug efflux pump
MVVLFVPGLIGGAVVGKIIIHPVNAFLGGIFKGFNKLFDQFTAAYGWTIGRMVRVSFIVLVIYGGLLFLTVRTLSRAPTGFIPEQDQGYLLVNVQLPDSASVQRSQEVMAQVQRIALGDKVLPPGPGEKSYPGIPGVGHTVSVAGQSFLLSANGSNFGSCYMVLEPFEERKSHEVYDAVVAENLRKALSEEIEEAVISVFRAPPIMGLGNAGGFQFQTQQRGYVNYQELQQATDDIIQQGRKDPRLGGLFTMFRAETPQLFIDIDRTKCESLQVDLQDVFTTLQVYMGGQFVNLFNRFGRTWQVNLMAEPKYRTQAKSLKQLYVRNKQGEMVPLATLVNVNDIGGPVMVMRYNMYPSAAVNGAPAAGVSSGQAINIVTDLANKNNVPFEWTLITYLQLQEGSAAAAAFGLGTLLIFLVLAAKYESWKLPMSIILVVPMCLLCAVTGMLIAHLPVDIFVQVGFLVLVALAAKNAILIVEFAEELRKGGKPLDDATEESSRLRLRPIIMTSFAFILGVVPLVISHGAGAEMRRSLGLAVFSGMLGVTFFGIMLTPIFYNVIMKRGKKAPTGPAAPPPVAHHTRPAEPPTVAAPTQAST